MTFLWTEEVTTPLGSWSNNHIDMEVIWSGCDQRSWITGFYGEPVVGDKWKGWEVLRLLRDRSNLPWVCCDFNEILHMYEKWGGADRSENQIDIR